MHLQILSTSKDIIFEGEANDMGDLVLMAIDQNVSLANADLRYLNLCNKIIRDGIFDGANLEFTNVAWASFINCSFRNANIRNIFLKHNDILNCDFSNAIITRITGESTHMENSTFKKAYLNKITINTSTIKKCNMEDGTVEESNIATSLLCELRLEDLICKHIKFNDTTICDCDFTNVRFRPFNRDTFTNTDVYQNVTGIPFDKIPLACPQEGAFIGWKVILNCNFPYKKYLVKLQIPASAKRTSSTSSKCRCDKAKVLKITDLESSENVQVVTSSYNKKLTKYEVGQYVYPDKYNDDRNVECTNGIHFFITKNDALNYLL